MKRFYKFLMPLVAIVTMALPVKVVAQDNCDNGTITVANAETSTTTTGYCPGYSFYNYSVSEVLVLASELEGLGGEITSMQFKPNSATAGSYFTNCEVYLALTTQADLSAGWIQDTSLHLVFTGDLSYTTTDWQTITFDSAFNYDPSYNLVVLVRRGHGAYSSGSSFEAYNAGAIRARYAYTDSAPFTIGSIPGSASNSTSSTVPLYKFTGCYLPVACAHVGGVTASNINATDVTISWIDSLNTGATYEIINMADSMVMATNVTDTSAFISSLTPNTVYNFGVYAVCNGSDVSTWQYVTFRTACAPLTTLPYAIDFDNCPTGNSNLFDPCWTIYNTVYTSNYPYVTSGYLYTYLYSSGGINNHYAYAMLPEMSEDLDNTDMELSFDIWGSSTASYGGGVIVAIFDSSSYVGTPTFDTVAVIIPTGTSRATAQTMYVSLVGHDHAGKRIGFFYQNQKENTPNYYYAYIDNVNLHDAPTCFVPENLTLNYVSADTIDISWQDPTNNGASYWVEYRPAGSADSVAWAGVEVYDTNAVLEPLSANTAYDIRVRALCGGDDTSFALIGNYRTGCGLITSLPWTEDFNSMSTTSSATQIPCWEYIGAGGYVNITSSYSHSGNCVRFYPNSSSSNDHILVLPEFDTATSGLQMSFWTRPETASGSSGSFSVGYVTDVNDATTFVETLHLESTDMTTTVTQYEANFPGAPDSARIAMRHNVNSTAWYWFIDDVNVHAAPECNHPVGLTVLGATATEATIGWGGDEEATYRVWFIDSAVCDTATAPYEDIDSTHYTFTGLNPSTVYTATVAMICEIDNSLTATVSVTFTTPEVGVPVPYTTGFEAADDTAWTFLNGTQTNQWVLGNVAGNPGRSIYISEDNGTSNSYSITSTSNVYAYKTFEMAAGQYAISFDWRANGESCCDYMRAYLAPASVELAAGTLYSGIGTTTTPSGWIALDGNNVMNVNSNWQTKSGVAIVPANSTYRLIFVWHNDGSVGSAPAGAIDNVSIVQLTCPQPTALRVDSTSTNSIDVHWTAGGEETAWSVRIDGGAWQSATTTSYQFTGLNSGTNYTIDVRAVCGEGDTSFITSTASATDCAPISVLPYSENFNSWGTGTTVHAPNCYAYGCDYSTSYPYITDMSSQNQGGAMYLYNYDNGHVGRNTWFALPILDSTVANVNQTQLVFKAYTSTSSYVHWVRVGVNTTPTITGATWIDTVRAYYGTWTEYEIPFDSYTGNGHYIIVSSFVDSAYSYSYPYIDDLTLEMIPSCQRPDTLTVSNATPNSVDLAWHDRAGASNWIIEYGPLGFQLGTGTIVAASSNPFTLTGLPAAYQGEYYVKAVCSASDTGDYSRHSCVFNTSQIPATLPYDYDFEDAAEWANWQTSSNSATNNWFRGNAVSDSNGSYSMYVSADGGATYKPYLHNATVNAAAYRDIDFGPIDSSFTLTFRARVGGTIANYYDGLMVFLVDPALPTTPSTSNITTPWGNVNDLYRIATARLDTTWQTYEASFDTISGIHRVAFFWFNQNTSGANLGEPAAVDNIHIDYSSCPRPLELDTMAVTGTTATLTWTGDANAGYQVIYRIPNHANNYATTNTNSITLTGLTSNATYYAWVRKLCGEGDTSLTSDGISFHTSLCDGASMVANYDTSMTAGTSSYSPIGYSYYNYSYVQTIIDSAYMANLGGDVTAFAFNAAVATGGDKFDNMTVYMANVPESDLTSGWITPSATHVFHKVVDSASFNYSEAGLHYFSLDTAFAWDGHSNVLFAVKRDNGTYASGSSFVAHTHSAAKMRYDYNDYDPYDITDPDDVDEGSASATVGDIILVSCGPSCPNPVVTSVDATYNSITVNWSNSDNTEAVIMEGEWNESTITTGNPVVTTGTYTFNSLTDSTVYSIGLRTLCDDDMMSDWTVITVTTLLRPCFDPSDPTVTNVTLTSAVLGWTPGRSETTWELHVSGTNYDQTFTVTTNPYTLTGLAYGVTYTFEVRAVCGEDVYSSWTESQSFTTLTCQGVTGVAVNNVTENSAVVTWNAPDNAETFEVNYGQSGFTQGSGTIVTANGGSYTITGLTAGMMYDVYVRTVCEVGVYSDWSTVATFETRVGIDNVDNNLISLYPNPASSTVTLMGIEGTATVTVVDMNGRETGKWTVNNGELTIDVTEMAQGAYFVRIVGEQVNAIRKLIVR